MKNKITMCFLLLSAAIFAQDDQTLFDDVNRIGGWGGPLFEYTNLDKDVEVNSGGGGSTRAAPPPPQLRSQRHSAMTATAFGHARRIDPPRAVAN